MDRKVDRRYSNRQLPGPRIATPLLLVVALSMVGYRALHKEAPNAPEALLKRPARVAWVNSWMAVESLYRRANINSLKTADT